MPKQDEPNWGRIVMLGLEMAVGVALGLAVGSFFDRRFGSTPTGALIGCLVGVAGGMYLVIKEAIRANKD
jgi:F0F1-type ATP synthase assembly protein I